MTKLRQRAVLRYERGRRSQATVRRHFLEWRTQQDPPIPLRCDNPTCHFFSGSLLWNGKPIRLVLDHINGVSGDNNPTNLRLLCPNCNSQQTTHGGSNKGRVIQDTGGYAQVAKDGKRHYVLPAEPGEYKVSGSNASFSHKRKA
jgi:5-methylcytosine-specific restriction endonuclease McrA